MVHHVYIPGIPDIIQLSLRNSDAVKNDQAPIDRVSFREGALVAGVEPKEVKAVVLDKVDSEKKRHGQTLI